MHMHLRQNLTMPRGADPIPGSSDPSDSDATSRVPDEVRPAEIDEREADDSAAAAIADKPRLWRAMLFAHQPDRHGRCITCIGAPWPCGPRTLAERAEEIHRKS